MNQLSLFFKGNKATFLLLFYSLGVIVFFVIRELIVDKLYSQEFGPEKEKFKLSIFIVFLQAVVNTIFSLFVPFLGSCIFRPKIVEISQKESHTPNKRNTINKNKSEATSQKDLPPKKPPSTFRMFFEFSIPAIAQLVAGYLGNKSMEFVDGSTKTIAKSTKPIPIMLIGMLFRGKRYHFLRYIAIFSVTAGISVFMLELQGKKENEKEIRESWIGFGLSVLALLMDGVVANTQDVVREKYNPSATALMFSTNIWATVLSAVSLVTSGESKEVIHFISNNPGVLYELLLFSIATPIGNHFIFLLIHEFGSLQCSIVTTIRKFLTILVNTLLLGRSLSPFQWISVVAVFGGLELDRHGKDLEGKLAHDKKMEEKEKIKKE